MAAKKISLIDAGRYEFRGEKKFELRMADSVVKTNFVYDEIVLPQRRTHIKRLFTCCMSRSGHRYGRIGSRSRASNTLSSADAPDVDFCADAQVKLTNGITAYRLTEPQSNSSLAPEDKPLIVCLHDLSNCSYMWADAVDLLADCDQGPRARVLVLDFYGRGRSPWIGVPCTLEVFVLQIKELLDFLNLSKQTIQLIGHGMGGLIATGFCAKFPAMVSALTLIAPMGISFMKIPNEEWLRKRWWAPGLDQHIWFQKRNIKNEGEQHFFDTRDESPHRYLVDKQIAMTQWQIENTPGYMEALLSTLTIFPLRSTEELFAAVGRHPRPVLILWGDRDQVTPCRDGVASMQACFDNGTIVDIRDAGHNPLAEKFNDTMLELLSFAKESLVTPQTPESLDNLMR